MTNTNRLKDIINDRGIKCTYIASRLGISRQSLSQKINGRTRFNNDEIKAMCDILKIKKADCFDIFLA